MAIIKCKMCGGSIEISADKTYGTCDSCGSTMTFPKVSDEQRVNLFNRANHFRRQNEFDKAIAAYERILEQDNTDAEAHWGVVLSRYGIEYVEDPVSHERIPTCHRVQLESILTDTDYLAAKENAPDTYSAELYEKEAKQIAEIQKGILAISAQEDPYDVFICYKESTDGGSRTKDSTLAQDIYYQLTNDGYKVFFSRITLEDKLGKQYEPYIFAALNSAKVMLVIGTKPEYLNAVWVKNEWSRYLALMKQDRSKLLIPCYRDMDPYDLPEELSALQSQDMSKIGFMQDLLHGIKKVLDSEKEETAPASGSAGPGVKSLLTRAQLFLEDGNFASANEYADKVLDIDPKYAPAYIVKVQVKEKVRKEADLAYCKHALTNDGDYQKAVRFADPQNKAVYEGYNQTIIKRLEEESREEFYRNTVLRYKNAGDNQQELLKIASDFDRLKDYKDSAQQAKFCREKAERLRIESEQRAAEAKAKREREQAEAQQRFEQAELERKRRKEQERIEEERRKKRNKKTATIFVILLIILAIAGAAWYFVMRPSKLYEGARYARMEGKYDEAITALEEVTALPAFSTFAGIGGFEDAENIIQQCQADKLFAAGDYVAAFEIYNNLDNSYHTHKDSYESMYQTAVELVDAGELEAARESLIRAGTHKDAQELMQAIDDYNTASILIENGDYTTARSYFSNLSILDSAEKLEACYAAEYSIADELYRNGDIASAHNIFLDIAEYSDATIRATQIETDYSNAATMVSEGRLDDAIAIYAALGNYEDSVYNKCSAHYQKGMLLWEDGDKIAAEKELASASQSCDVTMDLQRIRTEIANDAFAKKDYATALKYYVMLPQTDELKAKEYQLAQICYEEGAYEQAVAAYEVLEQYELSVSKLPVARYAYAAQLFDNSEYAKSAEQFSLLNGATDSAERTKEALYFYGKQQMEQNLWDEAKATFTNISNYKDADTQIKECDYRKATDFAAAGSYTDARVLFESLKNYSDSVTQARECGYQIAEAELAIGNYTEAQKQYESLDGYSDSIDKINLCIYEQANILLANADYAAAETLYVSISGYEDSTDKVKLCRYEQGNACYAVQDYEGAIAFYTGLNYNDSEILAAQCHCVLAKEHHSKGNIEDVIREYAQATILLEAQEALYDIGKDYAATNQIEKAIEALWACCDYEPALEMLAELAELLEQNGNVVDAAIARYAIQSRNASTKAVLQDMSIKLADRLNAYTVLKNQCFVNEILYLHAQSVHAIGEYEQAYSLFATILNYRDVDSIVANDANLSAAALNAKFTVGNCLEFGTYPQTANGTDNTPIEWLVLDRKDNKALLVSKYGLDTKPFNYSNTYVTWETCSLRSWLNNQFIDKAFTDEEQVGILMTNVDNSLSQNHYLRDYVKGENDTQDKIFLLSYAEANKYLGVRSTSSNSIKACLAPTEYAIQNGAYVSDSSDNKTSEGKGSGYWWLRSMGFSKKDAGSIYPGGSLNMFSSDVDFDSYCVRPAMWVNIESGIF